MSNASAASPQPDKNTPAINHWLIWLSLAVGLAVILSVEFLRWQENGFAGWLSSIQPDSTPFLFLYLVLPVFWFLRKRNAKQRPTRFKIVQTWLGPETKPTSQTNGVE